MTHPEDRELAARIRSGDATAFDDVFRRWYGPLCGFEYGFVHARADAEDVVQSAFLGLWAQHAELELRTTLRAYLFASVRNHALNRSARARLEQRWLEENADVTPAGMHGTESLPPDARVQSAEVAARVHDAIEALPPGARRVLLLRWQQQLSHAEIAEALHISVKGVENQLTRARHALRLRLGDLVD